MYDNFVIKSRPDNNQFIYKLCLRESHVGIPYGVDSVLTFSRDEEKIKIIKYFCNKHHIEDLLNFLYNQFNISNREIFEFIINRNLLNYELDAIVTLYELEKGKN
jgi:hypothetical protein